MATDTTANLDHQTIEMQINNIQEKIQSCAHDESISSPKMAVFGISDCYLQFYPKGSFWCTKENHYSLLFGCPTNVDVDILMYAGNVSRKPDELLHNEETNEKIYGFHDFGDTSELLKSLGDQKEVSGVAVGVEFVSISFKDHNDKESEKIIRITID
eukprot:GHVS01045287.1.p1 GENE.GHVS01045287.1~~GHVS01045287.1.p1  ORF type:complete len:157 (+),score=29.05 GHVS01045287.1:184-654(+)